MGERVLYLCNGKNEKCIKKDCYLNGGTCRHTKDVCYARNFQNFNEGAGDIEPLYEEKELKRRTVAVRVDMKEIRKIKREAEQLIALLKEANSQAAPLDGC